MLGSITPNSVFVDAVKLNIKAVASGVRVTAACVDAMIHMTVTGIKLLWSFSRDET